MLNDFVEEEEEAEDVQDLLKENGMLRLTNADLRMRQQHFKRLKLAFIVTFSCGLVLLPLPVLLQVFIQMPWWLHVLMATVASLGLLLLCVAGKLLVVLCANLRTLHQINGRRINSRFFGYEKGDPGRPPVLWGLAPAASAPAQPPSYMHSSSH